MSFIRHVIRLLIQRRKSDDDDWAVGAESKVSWAASPSTARKTLQSLAAAGGANGASHLEQTARAYVSLHREQE